MTSTTFLTVAIPYVNASPHVGYAFELVEADLVARSRRRAGHAVRFAGGTDDHSLKNVLAADAQGVSAGELVGANGQRFVELADRLGISFDDFVHTSTDPRHRPAVERVWRACAASGDLYRRPYRGHYCVGCEQFYDLDDLDDGRCREHGTVADEVVEDNWFFRLSAYGERLAAAIETDELLIEPQPFRAEVLAFVRRGLEDFSVSRSVRRARGWGIPVPDDPSQVVAVWFDALVNYLSGLGYGTDDAEYHRWWVHSDERIHVVGKGITRFHAVYWPAILLSAGVGLPTRVHVHPYLTERGAKISKSAAVAVDPAALADEFGVETFRWWVASAPSVVADTDFSIDALTARFDTDLANGVGNTLNRILTLLRRAGSASDSVSFDEAFVAGVDDRLAAFDRRGAAAAIVERVAELNRTIERERPWALLDGSGSRESLDGRLGYYRSEVRSVLAALAPVADRFAAALLERLDHPERTGTPVPRRTPP